MGAFIHELLQGGVYKRTQGRIARQVTFGGIVLTLALGLLRMSSVLKPSALAASVPAIELWLPAVLFLIGGWIAFRLVNVPSFADFLIAVEAEMNKVNWPSRGELFRASMVVIFTLFFLAAILFFFDFFWLTLFQKLGVI